MPPLSVYGSIRIKSENGVNDNGSSDDHDCVPLKHRLKMLLARKRLSDLSNTISEEASRSPSAPPIDVAIKKEDRQCDFQEERSKTFSPEQRHTGTLRDYSCQGTERDEYVSSNGIKPIEANGDTVLVEKVDARSSTLTPCSMLSKNTVKEKVDLADHNLTNSRGNGMEGALGSDVRGVKIRKEIADDFKDLDHVVLKERRRLLLSRKSLELAKPVMEGNCSWLSNAVMGDTIQRSISREKEKNHHGDAESLVAGTHSHAPALSASDFNGTKSAEPGVTVIKENDRICSSKKPSITNESFGGYDFAPVSVKIEKEIPDASYGDEVDHMLLRNRIKLLASKEPSSLDSSRNFECPKKNVPFVLDCSPSASEFPKPIRINRPRKKRKTATDSVETAMEEDAPGLLQVLIEKGVLVNEIKLYGDPESGEAIDDSEDSFSELEDVISKLFSHRQSLLKLPPLRCTKAEKASYCLACLISLVEQARYLQFLKWPVEWGWCRDLQSFIFVFERHNRIVLERPEYGFATYFFELVDSLPIHWQIKRLVTAMKLSSCSRVTLIENKALTNDAFPWVDMRLTLGILVSYCAFQKARANAIAI